MDIGQSGPDPSTTDPYESRYSLAGIRAATTAPQRALIARATEVFDADDRILAAYLVGGFAVGTADAWSDVDLQCIIADDAKDDLTVSWKEVAKAIGSPAYIQPFQRARWRVHHSAVGALRPRLQSKVLG